KTAVEDRPEIASHRLLDQDGGDAALAAAPPDPRHVNVAPFHRWPVARPHRVRQLPRQERRLASPVAQVLAGQTLQERVARYQREELTKSILRDAESETSLQRRSVLLEDDYL